ncbi:MAG: S24 family peptidase [Pseudomonadota bacterium]
MPASERADEETYARIAFFEDRLSAGDGLYPSDNLPRAEVAFRREFFQKNQLNPANCAAMYVSGDSMEPHLHDGDLALIDLNTTTISDHKVYAIRDGDELKVKRLMKTIGALVLLSDNPAFPPVTRENDDMNTVQVLGRLVWSGHLHS